MIETTTKLIKSPEILASEMDDELVMMSFENNAYYGLDSIGRAIWELLDSSMTPIALADCLIKEYDVTQEQCLNDILPFLETLLEKKLIVIA